MKWFSHEKGYGFIQTPDGGDLFLHYSAVQVGDFREVVEGASVEYDVAQGDRGPQAEDVRLARA